MFQSYALFPNLTVAENIGYGLRGSAWPKARKQQRVTELLHLVGLADQIAKYPAQLSGGQQQRVALARALLARLRPVRGCCCLMNRFRRWMPL